MALALVRVEVQAQDQAEVQAQDLVLMVLVLVQALAQVVGAPCMSTSTEQSPNLDISLHRAHLSVHQKHKTFP